MNKRYHNEETTLDYSINGFKVRVWIVNPYQKNEYTVELLESYLKTIKEHHFIHMTQHQMAEVIVELVVEFYPDIAAVQVIRPDGVGHMVYTTEYNGDPVEVLS